MKLEFLNFCKKKLKLTLRPIFWPKNLDLKKIIDLKVHCNLKADQKIQDHTTMNILQLTG